MPQLSTADLALLHLDSVPETDGPSAAYGRSIPGIVEALSVGETVAGRVELLTSLQAVTDDGLVEREVAPVDGFSRERTTFRLTADGRAAVEARLDEIGEESVVVERADGRSVVEVADLPDAVPELSLVEALGSLTADDVLRVYDGDGFVDREAALATFESCLDAVEDGTAATVLVSGEHGMGKTTLVEAAFDDAHSRGFELFSGAAREQSEPYAAFRAALADHRADAPRRLFEGTDPATEANLEERRRSFFYEVAAFLRDLSANRPVALFLDDLERADPATVSLFEYLSSVLEDDQVLLVGAVTPGGTSEDGPFATDDASAFADVTRLELEGFDRAATERYVGLLLDDTAFPERFVEAVQDLTGGNPQFVQASVRYMVDEGTIDPRAGYYPPEAADLPVPDGIQSVVLERIGDLDPGTESVLERGSVIGETMRPAVLEAVLDGGEVESRIDRLVDVGVWRRDEDGVLRFTSDVVREVVHDSLADAQRARSHEEVAAALKEVYGDDRDAHAAEIASHYRAGGATERAIEWYERAGEHAAGVYAHETAVAAYERALELARDIDREDAVLRLMAAIGHVHMRSDDYEEAQRYFEYVTERSEDVETLRPIAAVRAKICIDRGEYEAAVETADRALADWDGESPSEAVCKLLVRKAGALSSMGDVDEARTVGERALSMAEALDSDELRALVLKVRGVTEHYNRSYEESVEFGRRAAAAARAAGAERALAGIYNNIAGSRTEMGDFDGAIGAFERSRDRWQAIGNRVGEAVPLGNIGYAQTRLGRFDEARANLEASAELGERLDMDGHLVFQWLYLGELYINEGNVERAREYIERGLELAEEINQTPSIYTARAHLSRVCRLEDDHEAALDHAEFVLEEADSVLGDVIGDAEYHYAQIRREQGDVEEAISVHREALERENAHWKPPVVHRIGLAMAEVEGGDAATARGVADRAAELAEVSGHVLISLGARTAVARARHAAGESDAAEAILRDVHAEAGEIGSASYECQAGIALGSVLVDVGDATEAREVLERAAETADEIGAALFARLARETLASID